MFTNRIHETYVSYFPTLRTSYDSDDIIPPNKVLEQHLTKLPGNKFRVPPYLLANCFKLSLDAKAKYIYV